MTLETRSLEVAAGRFTVEVAQSEGATRTVVFAAGRGGSPLRHLGLLHGLAGAGFNVIAPHFEMIASSVASDDDLRTRLDRITAALDAFAPSGAPLIGAGHSIGATLMLVLAGAQAVTFAGELVSTGGRDFARLLLFAPPTAFFRGPGALEGVTVPVTVWGGTHDAVTPHAHAHFLKEMLGHRAEVRLVDGAGHFTFMDELPPGVIDPYPDRLRFLRDLADEVCQLTRTAQSTR